MANILEYFKEVGTGLKSLVTGMAVTGKEFVTPKITEQYPENRQDLKISDRFRAELTLIYDSEGRHKCIACGICQMNCPNGTIHLDTKMVELPDGKKKRKLAAARSVCCASRAVRRMPWNSAMISSRRCSSATNL